MQLDSSDEQAAAIRRELDGRLQKVSEMEKVRVHFLVDPPTMLTTTSLLMYSLGRRVENGSRFSSHSGE